MERQVGFAKPSKGVDTGHGDDERAVVKPIRVLFAAAEAAPVARVGGLAEAAAGLIRALRNRDDVEVMVVLPDYDGFPLEGETHSDLDLPEWAQPATVRTGTAPQLGEVHLVAVPGMAKPHPYVDASGNGWPDNTERFFGFSAAVAKLTERWSPDVLHLNDWHTALALGWTDTPSVYTIHTLGYQGEADIGWLRNVMTERGAAFDRYGTLNPAAGAIRLADTIVAVSPNYAAEILDPARSAGLHAILSARGDALTGIRNGIDASIWNPAADPLVPTPYSAADPTPKDVARAALLETVGWGADDDVPTIGMVTRLVEQKGIDIALGLVPYLERMRARLVLLGSGEERLSLWAKDLASRHPDHLHFVDGYDVRLAHSIFAGSDLFLMPSRFEPCGLAQMQAMAYGSIPVVTPVGGLVDTVFDADEADRETGNGFMSLTVDGLGVLDALHRAVAAWRDLARRRAIQWAGMAEDWSWEGPAEHHMKLYRDLLPGDASE